MIYLERTGNGCWEVMQHVSIGNIERNRSVGTIVTRPSDDSFIASVTHQGRETIAFTSSLPAAIRELIDFHKLTDYQYAPWPKEEDEE